VFDRLRSVCTTDKRLAFRLVSRFYRIGYSVLVDCRYRRLAVLLVLLLLPSLDLTLSLFALKVASVQARLSVFGC
jgi:hypothetical protein